jgi:RES domain
VSRRHRTPRTYDNSSLTFVSKFPEPPGVAALRDITPQTLVLPADTKLARIYFATGPNPSHWNQFRSFGPTAARWDHHLQNAHAAGVEQEREVYYCAPDVDTCAAEVFQTTRRIDRTRNAPGLVVFVLREAVTLLDLRGILAMPEQPQFHCALNDDMLVEVLQQIALRLSYGLR